VTGGAALTSMSADLHVKRCLSLGLSYLRSLHVLAQLARLDRMLLPRKLHRRRHEVLAVYVVQRFCLPGLIGS